MRVFKLGILTLGAILPKGKIEGGVKLKDCLKTKLEGVFDNLIAGNWKFEMILKFKLNNPPLIGLIFDMIGLISKEKENLLKNGRSDTYNLTSSTNLLHKSRRSLALWESAFLFLRIFLLLISKNYEIIKID
jgi:hypothetical protein